MLWQNLSYSVRSLLRSPLLTSTAVLALALGIGANTALFSVIDAVLLKPLDYPHAERIVELMRQFPGQNIWSTSAAKYAFWRDGNHSFDAVATHSYMPLGLNLVGRGNAERLAALAASADYFRVLGVQPAVGRSYTASEDKPGGGNVAVLSHALARRLFGKAERAVGQTLALSGASYQVVGVMPRGFDTPGHPDLWVPLQLKIDGSDMSNDYPVLARLKPGVSLASAAADMKVVADRFRQHYGKNLINDRESIAVVKFHDFLVGDARQPLWILLAAVGFVLLIACANVANLLLIRAAGRRRELAVRIALGANGQQITAQLLTESLLLALAGAVLGCLLAALALPLLIRLAPQNVPQLTDAALDGRVLLYALGIALATGILFGLFPALQSARLSATNPLREAGARTTSGVSSGRARQSLVVFQIAVTLLLLAGAGLLVQTLRNLQAVQPGFAADHVLTMEMSLTPKYGTGPALASLNEQIAERLETIPGVDGVATSNLPPLNALMDLPFEIVGRPVKREDTPDEKYRLVSPGYFSTLRIPVVQGREFTVRDSASSMPVAVINQALARKYFPHENPIGQQIVIGRLMGPLFADNPRRIVGVVGDVRDNGLGEPAPPEMFEPEAQVPARLLALDTSALPLHWLVRTAGNPMAIAARVRRDALAVAGDVPLAEPQPLTQSLRESLARQRFVMTLLSVLAALALLLGTIGLYGVVSYSVARRTRELGVRSALGARRLDLLSLVMGEGMRLAGAGVALGLLAALALTRYLGSFLYGLSATDPAALLVVTLLLAAVALLAAWVPAWRASRTDPLVALREE